MIHPTTELRKMLDQRFQDSADLVERFFRDHVDDLSAACQTMARRFERDGRLFVCGTGACHSDAHHVAVEFIHPVIAGNRALPAIALPGGADNQFAMQIDALGDEASMLLALSDGEATDALASFGETFRAARRRGLLTVAFTRSSGDPPRLDVDFHFSVPTADPLLAQEVQETAYHVLWELVHVLLRPAPAARQPHTTDWLYPFLTPGTSGDAATDDAALDQVRASMLMKAQEITELRRTTLTDCADDMLHAAIHMSDAFARGARLWTFGNGGSATDAADFAFDLLHPPRGVPAFPAVALDDPSCITAVGNDVGFEHVFTRQLLALARSGDIAVTFTTSGSSLSILAALRTAADMGLHTIALTGGDGGRCVELRDKKALDRLWIAPSSHIPRIQEAHAHLYHTLCRLVQRIGSPNYEIR